MLSLWIRAGRIRAVSARGAMGFTPRPRSPALEKRGSGQPEATPGGPWQGSANQQIRGQRTSTSTSTSRQPAPVVDANHSHFHHCRWDEHSIHDLAQASARLENGISRKRSPADDPPIIDPCTAPPPFTAPAHSAAHRRTNAGESAQPPPPRPCTTLRPEPARAGWGVGAGAPGGRRGAQQGGRRAQRASNL